MDELKHRSANTPATVPPIPPVQTTTTQTGQKSYMGAVMLSLLLGGIGVDRFYLGYVGLGIVKILTFGGFGIWYLIDLILIFSNNLRPKDGSSYVGYPQDKKLASIFVVGVILANILSAAYLAYVGNNFYKAFEQGISVTNDDGTTAKIGLSDLIEEDENKAGAGTTVKPGTAIYAKDFKVSVSKTVLNPTVSGDKPDTGKQYLQIDFTVVNNGKLREYVPGTFYYLTSTNQQISPPETLDQDGYPIKDVYLTDKDTIFAYAVGSRVTEINRSLLFEIPVGDKGKLVWRHGIYEDRGDTYGTFELPTPDSEATPITSDRPDAVTFRRH